MQRRAVVLCIVCSNATCDSDSCWSAAAISSMLHLCARESPILPSNAGSCEGANLQDGETGRHTSLTFPSREAIHFCHTCFPPATFLAHPAAIMLKLGHVISAAEFVPHILHLLNKKKS